MLRWLVSILKKLTKREQHSTTSTGSLRTSATRHHAIFGLDRASVSRARPSAARRIFLLQPTDRKILFSRVEHSLRPQTSQRETHAPTPVPALPSFRPSVRPRGQKKQGKEDPRHTSDVSALERVLSFFAIKRKKRPRRRNGRENCRIGIACSPIHPSPHRRRRRTLPSLDPPPLRAGGRVAAVCRPPRHVTENEKHADGMEWHGRTRPGRRQRRQAVQQRRWRRKITKTFWHIQRHSQRQDACGYV